MDEVKHLDDNPSQYSLSIGCTSCMESVCQARMCVSVKLLTFELYTEERLPYESYERERAIEGHAFIEYSLPVTLCIITE